MAMSTNSKIVFFSVIVIISILAKSCSQDDTDVIPDVYVDFTIDLQDPEFSGLLVSGSFDTIDAKTRNWGERAAGFKGNGIIIYTGPDGFFAYDRTCPFDYAVNNLSVKVKVDFAEAVCPVCSTRYALAAFAVPVSGTKSYPLKNYNTTLEDERYLRVWNIK
jgi:nitrite reductase/ring-hydroxylating ferredoxin subunit